MGSGRVRRAVLSAKGTRPPFWFEKSVASGHGLDVKAGAWYSRSGFNSADMVLELPASGFVGLGGRVFPFPADYSFREL